MTISQEEILDEIWHLEDYVKHPLKTKKKFIVCLEDLKCPIWCTTYKEARVQKGLHETMYPGRRVQILRIIEE